jgi:RNA polymerase sigma-70 factor (ECF subfamily)
MVDLDVEQDWSEMADLAPAERSLPKHDIVAIQSAVNALPREQRHAIELAFFDGHTYEEIAGMLNEPLGTIKARIRRGLMKLREALHEYL